MIDWASLAPGPPEWRVDWTAVEATFAVASALQACPQDARHHGEGDVWTHTRMACEALVEGSGYRICSPAERLVLFVATLLHDLGKPASTRLGPDGRLTAPGHARRGAIQARGLLWRLGMPFETREQICALIRWHQTPFHLIQRDDAQRLAIEVSQAARCDRLVLLAEADARGRICSDAAQLLEHVALFAEFCRELGCLSGPFAFASDHSRFAYFRRNGRDPNYHAFDSTRVEVVLMCGLPGAGKDHWVHEHLAGWPVISRDALRLELGVDHTDNQGPVIARTRELTRGLLAAGERFVLNGTHLSRAWRSDIVALLADYDARVRIVYVEVALPTLLTQNQARPAAVPEAAIERLMRRWEIPVRSEAHLVTWSVRS